MQTDTDLLRRIRLGSLLIKASPAAVVLTDTYGMIEALNRVAQDWFGYEDTELLGISIDVIFPSDASSDDASRRACNLSQLSDPDPAQRWFLQARRKDGSTFPIQVTLHPMATATGYFHLANVIELSHGVPHQEKRIQRERLAAVLQMVSGLAHESRNALQRAQSCLDLLQLDLTDQSELMELTGQIREALKDIHRNYEEVKNYAAPITLKRTTVDLAKLCRSTFDELTVSLGNDAPRLTIHYNPAFSSVKLDASSIGNLLMHVLENAIHASKPGGLIEFHCDCPNPAKSSGIEIRVRDQGEGLTAEVEARMFEPFFTTKLQGTGLGLAVCRRIVQAHQGTVKATNHTEGGTSIKIWLPSNTAESSSP